MRKLPGLVLAILVIIGIYYGVTLITGCRGDKCEYTTSEMGLP